MEINQNLVSEYLNSSLANHPIFLHLHFFIYKCFMFLEVGKELLENKQSKINSHKGKDWYIGLHEK